MTLQQAISKLLFSEHLSDMTIGVGGQILPAHKLVLCSRSYVFAAMLTGGMKEVLFLTLSLLFLTLSLLLTKTLLSSWVPQFQ
jgi:hypothetical protein